MMIGKRINQWLWCVALTLLLGQKLWAAATLPDFAQTDALMPNQPREAYTQAEKALWQLKAQDPDRARWYALASEAAAALSLPDVAMRYAADGIGSGLADATTENRLTIALANALTLSGRPNDALQRLQPLLNQTDRNELIRILLVQAQARTRINAFREAVADLLRAYELASENGQQMSRAHVAAILGATYRQMHDEQRAETYLTEAITYFRAQQAKLLLGRALQELGQNYLQIADARAKNIFNEARENSLAVRDDQNVAYADFGLAFVALANGHNAEAKTKFESAYRVLNRVNDVTPLVDIERGLAELSLRDKALDLALAHIQKAEKYARNVEDKFLLMKVLRDTAKIQAAHGDFANAYTSSSSSSELRDQLITAEKDRTLAEMRVRFDSEQQEQRNSLLEKQAQLNKAQITEQQQRIKLILLSTATLAMLIGFLLYIGWRTRQTQLRLALLAMTDDLTGVSNRRALMELLQREFERARRYKLPLVVAMLDLDHFKTINDNYGHDAGDEVLRSFADMVSKSLRKTDAFGRSGGEEFIIVLPQTSQDEGLLVAERIRVATSMLTCNKLRGERQPTVSIGIALYQAVDTHMDLLLKRADDAMYAAKKSGRNCVILAS